MSLKSDFALGSLSVALFAPTLPAHADLDTFSLALFAAMALLGMGVAFRRRRKAAKAA